MLKINENNQFDLDDFDLSIVTQSNEKIKRDIEKTNGHFIDDICDFGYEEELSYNDYVNRNYSYEGVDGIE